MTMSERKYFGIDPHDSFNILAILNIHSLPLFKYVLFNFTGFERLLYATSNACGRWSVGFDSFTSSRLLV